MPVLLPICFLGLSQDERREQLYLALGGTDDGCFLGLTLIEKYREMLVLIGSYACIFDDDQFWKEWLLFLDPDACTGLPVDGLQNAVYALLYAEAGSPPSLLPPECFMGLPPEERDEAILIIVIEHGGGDLSLYEQPDGEFFYNQPDGDSFYLIPA